MSEMAERVDSVCDHLSQTDIYVDTQHLRYEQQDRKTWLDHALNKAPSVNWDDVLAAARVCQLMR